MSDKPIRLTTTQLYSHNLSITELILVLPLFYLSYCPFLHREAEGFKEQGNAFYIKKDYAEAFNYYTKAIGNYA